MPPPGIPDWLYPSVYVSAMAGGNRVWVDSVHCHRLGAENATGLRIAVRVRVRDIRWDDTAHLWRISRDSRAILLGDFLEQYSAPLPDDYTLSPSLELQRDPGDDRYPEEVQQEAPPAEPQVVGVAHASVQVRWSNGGDPEPEPKPDRLQLLMLYTTLCQLPTGVIGNNLTPNQKKQITRLVLRVAEQAEIPISKDGKEVVPWDAVFREALNVLEKLLLPQEPEDVPRTRFEREPLV